MNFVNSKIRLTSYSKNELKKLFQSIGEKKYRGEQIFIWIYKNLEFNTGHMTDLSVELRDRLKKDFVIISINLIEEKSSTNTKKYLFKLNDNNYIESVIIYDKDRVTLCVSSQVGCKLGCKFCATGKMGFIRNLSADEIVCQYLLIQKILNKNISNIVFMGMGEPFLNYDNTIKAAEIFCDQKGASIAHRKITISTAGIIPAIKRFITENHKFRLAISLNSAIDKLRNKLMPINRKYNLESLKRVLKEYSKSSKKEITFEYVLIKNINDSKKNIDALYNYVKDIRCKINLIQYNPFNSIDMRPTDEKIMEFYYGLKEKGLTVNIRSSPGNEIKAACGQLSAGYLETK